jgi:aspartyl-tRNA(Asn)/glutamyl-tRNA(Gln) amidotransferase subunit A
MANALPDLPVAAMAHAIATRQVSATDIVATCLRRIEELDSAFNSVVFVAPEAALVRAAQIDAALDHGARPGPLAGVPFLVKDNLMAMGQPATCGSQLLRRHTGQYDATVVARLKTAGAILLGKTNLDEFAMGSTTTSSCFGATHNPWKGDRSAGGSSGGSAAAVAAGLVPFALGSDTGGSVRQPAAHCGVTGFKPAWGSVSRFGLVAYASSLDAVGVLARSAEDAGLVHSVIAGQDPRDATTRTDAAASRSFGPDLLQQLRIGWCPGHFSGSRDVPRGADQVERATRELGRMAGQLVETDWPQEAVLPATYYIIAMSEASSNLSRFDGIRFTRRAGGSGKGVDAMLTATRSAGFGAEVRRRILLGTFALSSGSYEQFFAQASRVRRLVREGLLKLLQRVDLLALPVTTGSAPRLDAPHDPVAEYRADQFTVAANLAGLPAIALPCGFDAEGMPIGMQLMTRPDRESLLFAVGKAWQAATDWHLRRPPGA